MKPFLSLLLAPLLAACSVFGMRSGTEEPGHSIVARVGEVEIRRYPPRLVAELVVTGDEVAARNTAFRPLAAYIFGENTAAERIGMTAPVTQAGERIGMTAPVTQQGAEGRWVIGFLMPARYTRATLPLPRDPAINIRDLPAEEVAALRFSGVPTPAAVAETAARLRAGLAGSAWQPEGEGGAWFYDPPWTLPPLRRNEVWVAVRAARHTAR